MKDYFNGRLTAMTGDITKIEVDAIVNAANSSLLGGGGVDGAIHRAGGPTILAECRRLRETDYKEGLPTGQAVATTAGELPAEYVIHTVGPVWHGGNAQEDAYLAAAYENSLVVAAGRAAKSVAFPAISTGVYHFPPDRAARIAFKTIADHLRRNTMPRTVYLVFFSDDDYELFVREADVLSTEQDEV
jgi:O-acetyl-ADP-ribose deacetylase (regulator of RNase III)